MMDMKNILAKVQHHYHVAHDELVGYWGGDIGPGIDEMSLLFHDKTSFEFALEEATTLGWEQFNTSIEVLTCTSHSAPQFRKYTHVYFSFWRKDGVPYRIEAMTYTPGNGGLPLHDHALLVSEGRPVIIHASFKPRDYDDFISHQPGQPTLEYRNDYGKFSYWGRQATYLKPRVNLRDQP